MALAIVTHPHKFDRGLIKENLLRFLKNANHPVYFLRDGNKKAYGESLYAGELKPSNKLGRYGRASLTDGKADDIVCNHKVVLLAGGYLSECVGSTYNSLSRATERNKKSIKIVFLTDIVYLKTRKGKPVTLSSLLRQGSNDALNYYFRSFDESKFISHEFKNSSSV